MPPIGSAPTDPQRPAVADRFSGPRWSVLALTCDLSMLVLAVTTAIWLEPRGSAPGGVWLLGAILAAVTLGHLAARGAYGSRSDRRSALDLTREALSAQTAGAATALAIAALVLPDRATTTALVVAGAFGAVLVTSARLALFSVRRRARIAGRSGQRTLIVGAGRIGAELERRLLAAPGLGLRPVGFLDEDPSPAFWGASPSGRVLGAPRELESIARRTGARRVIIAFSAARDEDVLPLVRLAQALDLEVTIVPRMFEDVSLDLQIEHIGGMALCGLRTPRPQTWPWMLKHVVGRAVASAVVVILSPLLLAIALAVRLSSPGPLLYRQRRVGRDGREFEILKFRTMKITPEPVLSPVLHLVASGSGPGGVEGEDRRTAVGRLLRRCSLDELPQLLNVVRGHMSIVGPRPERPELVALFGREVRGYDDRHRVKSGMTGWAQVHGLRGQTSIAERIELDNWYVANWSPWLDVKILLLTPLEVLRSRAEAGTGTPPLPEPSAEPVGTLPPRRALPSVFTRS